MGSGTSKTHKIRQVLERKRVADLKTLKRATSGRSQSSLFRDLLKLDYLSSYTHAGRYYTLPGIPEFDEHRLWFHQGIGFSETGTLKETVVELLNRSPAGYLHRELESLVRVRVHNSLLDLRRAGRIRRESLGPRRSLYVSADPKRSAEQLEQRRAQLASKPLPAPPIHVGALDTVIGILVETINAVQKLPSLVEVTRRLAVRNVSVVVEQVEQVWSHYGIDRQKKMLESKPKPSKE